MSCSGSSSPARSVQGEPAEVEEVVDPDLVVICGYLKFRDAKRWKIRYGVITKISPAAGFRDMHPLRRLANMWQASGVGLATDADGEIYLNAKDTLRVLVDSGAGDQPFSQWISDLTKLETEEGDEESYERDNDMTPIKHALKVQATDDEESIKDRTIAKLKEDVAKLQRQLFQIQPELVTDVPDGGRGLRFLLIKKNSDTGDSLEEHFPYYVAVVMKRDVEKKIDILERRYPDMQVLLDLEEDGSIKLLDSLEDLDQVTVCENHLATTMAEEQLLLALRRLHKGQCPHHG